MALDLQKRTCYQDVAFYNIIDGQKRGANVNVHLVDPRTEETLWDVPVASAEDLDAAVDAANRAFESWKHTSPAERSKVLQGIAHCLRENQDALVHIHQKETGKSLFMATIDVECAALLFEHYMGITLEDEVQYEDKTRKIVKRYAPFGVVAAIVPWNFPLMLGSIKVVSALVTGNCVIVKPSDFAPYAFLKFCEFAQTVLPPGVFQALNGGADLGERMTLHHHIHHVSFTGTQAVGERILQNCAKTMKEVIIESAGNDAAIICEDADLARVVPSVATGCFFHGGQVCVASKRIYVHDSLYDKFMDMFVKQAKKYSANHYQYSPMSNRANYERAKSFLEDSKVNNHEIIACGDIAASQKGFWLAPTIVAKPPEDSMIVQQEQFAPIAPVLTWSDEDDVISRANLGNAGLGASVYTPDLEKARRIAERLECGSVWINTFERPHYDAYCSGWKQSGFGGELGKLGLYNYCQVQSLHFRK